MVPKLVSKSVAGILILLVMGAMAWQVAPAAAGFTPTPTSITPTETPIPPTETPIPPTRIPRTPIPPTATPTATPIPTETPPVLLPVSGEQASGLNTVEISVVTLVGVLVLLLAAISLVVRKSARTRTG